MPAMACTTCFVSRLPVLLLAGRAPYTLHGELTGSRDTYVHFVQDPFDLASLVRPYVKWEYTCPRHGVKEALARAAHCDAQRIAWAGLHVLPRETLAEAWDSEAKFRL